MTVTQKERIERLEAAVTLLTWWLYQLHVLGINDVWSIDAAILEGADWPNHRHAELSATAKFTRQPTGQTRKQLAT